MSRLEEVRERLAELHGEPVRRQERLVTLDSGLQVSMEVVEQAVRCKSWQEARARYGQLGEQVWREVRGKNAAEERPQQVIRQASPVGQGVAAGPRAGELKVGMFHHRGYLYFGRLSGGAVRILKLPEDPVYRTTEGWPEAGKAYPEAILDLEVDAGSWVAIMAFVSYRPEPMEGRVAGAKMFHMGQEEDNRPGMENGEPVEAKEAD